MPRRIIYIKNPSQGSNFRTINADQSNATINTPRSRKPRSSAPKNQPRSGPSNIQPPWQIPTINFPATPPGLIDPTQYSSFNAHLRGSKPSDFGYSLIDFSFDEGVEITLPDFIFSDLQEGPGPMFEDHPEWDPPTTVMGVYFPHGNWGATNLPLHEPLINLGGVEE